MAAFVVAQRTDSAWWKGEHFLPHVFIYLECPKNTLSEFHGKFALHLLDCIGYYGNEMLRLYFFICTLSVNHPQKCPRPSIGVVLELRSQANLPCLVNLALSLYSTAEKKNHNNFTVVNISSQSRVEVMQSNYAILTRNVILVNFPRWQHANIRNNQWVAQLTLHKDPLVTVAMSDIQWRSHRV